MKSEMRAVGFMSFALLLLYWKSKKHGKEREQTPSDLLECYCFCTCTDGKNSTRVRIRCNDASGADCANLVGQNCTAEDSQGNIIVGTLQNCEKRFFPAR